VAGFGGYFGQKTFMIPNIQLLPYCMILDIYIHLGYVKFI